MGIDKRMPCDFGEKVTDLRQWRKLYLVGEWVLTQTDADPVLREEMLAAFDRLLIDPDDRVLFGLSRNPPPNI